MMKGLEHLKAVLSAQKTRCNHKAVLIVLHWKFKGNGTAEKFTHFAHHLSNLKKQETRELCAAQTCMVYSPVICPNPCLHPAPTTLIVWALGLECPSVAAKFCEEEWLRQGPKPWVPSCSSEKQQWKLEKCVWKNWSKGTCRETLWQCSHMASTWSLQYHLGCSTPWTQVCTASMWHNTESVNLWCPPASHIANTI